MKRLNRPMTIDDLKDKGMPFECCNCGNKPTAEQVVVNHGDCEICGDTIKVYCVDAAEYVLRHNR